MKFLKSKKEKKHYEISKIHEINGEIHEIREIHGVREIHRIREIQEIGNIFEIRKIHWNPSKNQVDSQFMNFKSKESIKMKSNLVKDTFLQKCVVT